MPTSPTREVVRHLRKTVLSYEGAGLTDGQLLGRFVERRDEAAFAALVRRHGPMVWGVCRRVVRDHHDAEDAFQATFLVLVRRAAAVLPREMVANWLYGVAHQTARKARATAAKRRGRERQAARMPEPTREPDLSDDLRPLLDQELSRLPDKYRIAIVLCDLGGKTRKEAARQLGCPEGTVASRLATARGMLAKRLARRGLAVSGGVLVAILSQKAASAAVPISVVFSTIKAAGLFAAGQAAAGAVSVNVMALTKGVLKAMLLNKLKVVAAVLLVLASGLSAGGLVYQARAGGQPGTQLAQGPAVQAEAKDQQKPAPAAANQAPPARPVDREAWARKLAELSQGNWRKAFAVGEELAGLPADEGYAILEANWKKIDKIEARQQLLKALDFARHARLVDGLDLGMRDPAPEVQSWATTYLNDVAFQDFAEDFPAYKDWHRANRGKPLPEVVAGSARRFAAEAARAGKEDVTKRARWLARHGGMLREMPEARQAALDAGLLRTLERWASGATARSSEEEIERAADAVSAIGCLQPPEADLKRVVLPLLTRDNPDKVRGAAVSALEGRQNAWATEPLLGLLKESLGKDVKGVGMIRWDAARALASYGDPRVIPTLIAVIDADNTYDTVYGVGWFGLNPLTGVDYDKSHDGAWWRRWWEKNKERYPEAARSLEIPKLAVERQADKDVAAQDLRAGGDENKRYFLLGAADAKPPAAGYGLLIVLPGGDGSADFQPFLRDAYQKLRKDVLKDRWLMAQAVAPKWDDKQFDQIVWPTATSGYPAAKFTTEEFIKAIVADVRAKVKIDPRRVMLLGWSSGGPPCYAAALGKDSVVTGAFVAMSVFRPQQLPAVENAKGKAFYLLQSPDDRLTALRHAEAAEKALRAAGAKVRLRHYEGGHGWHGDVEKLIGDGMAWLDQQAGAK